MDAPYFCLGSTQTVSLNSWCLIPHQTLLLGILDRRVLLLERLFPGQLHYRLEYILMLVDSAACWVPPESAVPQTLYGAVHFCSFGDILSSSLLHRAKHCTAEGGDHSLAKIGLAGDHREGDEDDEALAEAVLDDQVVELGEVGGALCEEEVGGVGGEVEEDEEGEEEAGAAGQPGSRGEGAGKGQHLVDEIFRVMLMFFGVHV